VNGIVYGDERYALTETLMLCDIAGERRLLSAAEVEPPNVIAAFAAGKRDECFLIADASQPVRVNNVLLRGGLQPLRESDRVEIDGSVLTVRMTHEAQRGIWEDAADATRCPVCRATLRAGDEVVWCGRCRAPHHQRCFLARSGRCGVYGCLQPHDADRGQGNGAMVNEGR
jgi:hypothetical protein